jgi:predicted membrane protein
MENLSPALLLLYLYSLQSKESYIAATVITATLLVVVVVVVVVVTATTAVIVLIVAVALAVRMVRCKKRSSFNLLPQRTSANETKNSW